MRKPLTEYFIFNRHLKIGRTNELLNGEDTSRDFFLEIH